MYKILNVAKEKKKKFYAKNVLGKKLSLKEANKLLRGHYSFPLWSFILFRNDIGYNCGIVLPPLVER